MSWFAPIASTPYWHLGLTPGKRQGYLSVDAKTKKAEAIKAARGASGARAGNMGYFDRAPGGHRFVSTGTTTGVTLVGVTGLLYAASVHDEGTTGNFVVFGPVTETTEVFTRV
jgi:hypothetical protein